MLPENLPEELFSSGAATFYALWLRGQGREDEAAAVFREATRRSGSSAGSARAHFGVGVSFLRQGKPDEAVREFTAAISFEPEWATAFDALGEAFDQLGRYDKALVAFQEGLRLSPEYHTIHLHIGDMHTHKGDLHAALQAYRDAIHGFCSQGGADAHVRAANTLLALGEHTEALTLLLPLLGEFPNYTELHLSVGQALVRAGRNAEARTAFQRVLERCAQRKPTGWNDEEYVQFAATAQECLASLNDNRVDVENGNQPSFPHAFGGKCAESEATGEASG